MKDAQMTISKHEHFYGTCLSVGRHLVVITPRLTTHDGHFLFSACTLSEYQHHLPCLSNKRLYLLNLAFCHWKMDDFVCCHAPTDILIQFSVAYIVIRVNDMTCIF